MNARTGRRRLTAGAATLILALGALVATSAPAGATASRLHAYELRAVHYARSHGSRIGVAVVDTRTGRYTYAGGAHRLFESASVVKVLIATRLLLAGRMHGTVRRRAHLMIAESDNAAASALYPKAGGDDLLPWLSRHYDIARLGARPTRPGYWGTTQLTAIGLAHLYDAVRQDPRVWPWLSRAMGDHTPRSSAGEPNNFGVAAAAIPSAVKNGWVSYSAHGHSYAIVNTSGYVDQGRYAVVILTRSPGSYYYRRGEALITHEAKVVIRDGGLVPAAAVLTARRTSTSSEPIVVLDPGHNGGNAAHPARIARRVYAGYGRNKACNTTGTQTNGGYAEHRFTWDVAKRVRTILLRHHLRVVLTRHSDHGVGPCVNRRAAIESRPGVVAAVAIHADGAPSAGHGFHICEDSRRPEGASRTTVVRTAELAAALHRALARSCGLVPSTYVGHRGYYYRSDLAGLNLSTKPTSFLELGNMRNRHDAAIQRSPAGRQRIARAIAGGILAYLAR